MSLEKIKALLGPKNFIEDKKDIEPYVTAWRGKFKGSSRLVAFPKSTKEVSEILKICAESKIPVVPQCGNTGLVGGSVPSDKGDEIVLSLSRMNKTIEINEEDFSATFESGVILQNAQSQCAEKDLYFPVSLASEGSCQIGGIVSSNAGGNNVIKYGNTRENVLGLEVVLMGGKVLDGIKNLRKDNTGYDLKQIFIGSEGTLGVITKAVFRLFPLAKQKETLFIATNKPENISKIFYGIKNNLGSNITAFEYISGEAFAAVMKNIEGARNPFSNSYKAYVLIDVTSTESGDALRTSCENALALELEKGDIEDAVIAENLTQAKQFWFIREHITEALKKSGRGIPFDISVPISKMPVFIEETGNIVKAKFPEVTLIPFGHVGDGNIHFNMFFPRNIPEEKFEKAKEEIKKIVYAETAKYSGSISAEHGIGQERKAELKLYKSAVEIELMQKIKKEFDQLNLMNPGKIF